MTAFVVADENGVILRTGNCPASLVAAQARESETAVEGKANDATQYLDMATGNVVDKHVMTASLSKKTLMADGVDSIVVSGLPSPCTVILDSTGYNVPDGEFEFTVDLPGPYKLKVDALHHLPFETEVLADEG